MYASARERERAMSNVTDIQEIRLIKMRKELQAEIDLTLAWIDEVAARNGWTDKREGE